MVDSIPSIIVKQVTVNWKQLAVSFSSVIQKKHSEMNQLVVLSIIVSCIGLAVCIGGENYPSYNEILKHASNPRAKHQANLQCSRFLDEVEYTSGFQLGLANTFAQCGT